MAAEAFNSLGGYSVGIPPVPVIDANGNVITNVLVTSGNVTAANVYAANYYYANGMPFNAGGNPYGPNNSIQFNGNGTFNGSGNLTFDDVTNLLTVPSINVNGLSNLGPISNITITGGGSGYLLTTDGNGIIQWSPPGTGSAISNGNSNVSIATFNGNITAGVNGTDNVLVISNAGMDVAGNISSNNVTINENLIANTFQMGFGIYEFYHASVYFATTATADPNQVLWSTSLANLSAIDFTIISTDETSNTRQTAKIAAAILGTEVVFNEYSGLYINGGVGSFSVIYQAGSPDSVQLVVTPDYSNPIKYNMMIVQYAN
jgi:hypothetical protein